MSNKNKGNNDHRYSSLPVGEYDDDDDRNNWSDKRFAQKLNKQNDNLDILEASTNRLGEISLNISKEIDLQNRMLSNLEGDVSITQEKVEMLTRKTRDLVKKSGGPKTFCLIITLICILLILTMLVIYT